jgi:hypothetical protein
LEQLLNMLRDYGIFVHTDGVIGKNIGGAKVTQKTTNNPAPFGWSHLEVGNRARRIPHLEERAAALLGVYLAAACFIVAAYPETRHCMLRVTGSVGAGMLPLYLFARFSMRALVVLATTLAAAIPWLLIH